MKLISLELENFRSFQERRRIEIDDLTAIIGRNDIGKSTVLEALEIFFNNDGPIKIEQGDCNVYSSSQTVYICCEFSDVPDELSLDSGALTNLEDEYLLTGDGTLKIEKTYDCSKSRITPEAFIVAQHPSANGYENLLDLKEKDLQGLVKKLGLDTPLKGNPGMRSAIWESCEDLQLSTAKIPVTKPKEDSKRIWEQVETYLPIYALFQSDRPSKDSDGEVQNPLKGAIASAIAEAQSHIEEIQHLVEEKAMEIAQLTHHALGEIDPSLASKLAPSFKAPTPAKWSSLFSIGMDTDDRIPLNKRGSGVRRLILVSFFKAEAERKLANSERSNIIYAIEEPETSQHPRNQKILIDSFQGLASTPGCQVLLTTHSPGLASELPTESIRFISSPASGETPTISQDVDVFAEVADTLGLIPDSRVKVLFCVEGPTDVQAIKCLSAALHEENPDVLNLTTDPRIAMIPLGGGNLKHWVDENYMMESGLPEVHIYDRDKDEYAESASQINAREDGKGSWAIQTQKYEIECYLHPDAVKQGFGFDCNICDFPDPDNGVYGVAKTFGDAYLQNRGKPLKANNAKKKLANQAFPKMTASMIHERDSDGEILSWLERIKGML